ncbi:helix-turn-helix domain-containing protein [Candidatus Avelusimicrobium fimicolum]|uniref:helix-turn-helix domain-containing protein n=1 Tax=Candidatus Avelusimicrobium fimicolum TaxID=3416216 RepID=UPI003D0E7680
MPTLNRWISLNELCSYLGVSRETAIKWVSQKGLPCAKVGKLWKFHLSEIDDWMKSQK